ncbi:MAG: hypothetical protein PUE85_05125 [Firmicutes bacterium]|nr:hypothetical protein [Bacillota bacterium]
MNIIGRWGVSAVMSFADGDFKWVTEEESANIEDFDTSTFSQVMEFTPDGKLLNMIKIPENTPQEEIDNAVSAGMTRVDDYLVTGQQEWKEEDGKILYNSGVQGEVLGEEVSPWAEIAVDDNGEITVMEMIRMKKL